MRRHRASSEIGSQNSEWPVGGRGKSNALGTTPMRLNQLPCGGTRTHDQDENDTRSMAALCQSLLRLRDASKAALIVVHHVRKSIGRDEIGRAFPRLFGGTPSATVTCYWRGLQRKRIPLSVCIRVSARKFSRGHDEIRITTDYAMMFVMTRPPISVSFRNRPACR